MRVIRRPLLLVIAAAGTALAADVARPTFAQAAADATSTYYLEAHVNGRATGLIVQIDRDARGFVMSADELTEIGIRVDNLPLDADRRIALADVPDLQYHYMESEQRVELTLPDAQLVPERIGFIAPPPSPPQSGTGLLLNYAAHLQSSRIAYEQKQNARRLHVPLLGSARYGRLPPLSEQQAQEQYERRNRTFALSTELRLFTPRGVFVNSGYSTLESGRSEYTRQDSYWTYSDVERMRTWTVGDFISSSLGWSRAVRLGGISLARNFDVRPDLITFPVPALGGSAVVPTTVDLYINGLRQATAEASGGPFLFANPPAVSGAGKASIVFQDALGREVVIQRPLYMDTRLLAAARPNTPCRPATRGETTERNRSITATRRPQPRRIVAACATASRWKRTPNSPMACTTRAWADWWRWDASACSTARGRKAAATDAAGNSDWAINTSRRPSAWTCAGCARRTTIATSARWKA